MSEVLHEQVRLCTECRLTKIIQRMLPVSQIAPNIHSALILLCRNAITAPVFHPLIAQADTKGFTEPNKSFQRLLMLD